jgi:hypothetical protein
MPYLKENYIIFWISLSLARYPAGYLVIRIAGYPAGQYGIRPDTGYQKRPDYPAGYPAGRISGSTLI